MMAGAEDRARIAVATRVAATVAVAYVGVRAFADNWVEVFTDPVALFVAAIVAAVLFVILRIIVGVARRTERGERFSALGTLLFWSTLLKTSRGPVRTYTRV
jgi:hypothetical protein